MKTIETTNGISPEAWDELQAALDRLSKGIRDPEASRKSRERMDRMRAKRTASVSACNTSPWNLSARPVTADEICPR